MMIRDSLLKSSEEYFIDANVTRSMNCENVNFSKNKIMTFDLSLS